MSNQLLPCPFCGAEPAPFWNGVGCLTAKCAMDGLHISIEAWNRRATQSAAGDPPELEELGRVEFEAECRKQHRDVTRNDAPGFEWGYLNGLTHDRWCGFHMAAKCLALKAAPPAAAPVAAGEPVAFADELISGALQGGDFSGADIQELAVKHGLLCEERREEPCRDEGCACAEYGFPTECYRKTAALTTPAAAHEDEAVRKDADRYRWISANVAEAEVGRSSEFHTDWRRAWKLPLLLSQNAVAATFTFDEAIDAAMRAQGDGGTDHA